ncbi:saccharopine dehydrogenase NADP-binding domain-containing protein [[Kitasatospora] papulosa]|uniref:saccharopine dehydrogenase NADP-binding domain-containing protein n=1 Tax=[Kitasatospora] papulosa TaxID=1464011 RepID=UPI0036868550
MAELLERGFLPVLAGRDEEKLRALAEERSGLDVGVASVDDPASLDRALTGVAAVVNSAGPFATTAAPLIEAALRAGSAYVDMAAEIEANVDTFAHFAHRARAAGAVVVPPRRRAGHLRRHGAAGGGGGLPHPRWADQDGRCRLRGPDLRRRRFPPRAVRVSLRRVARPAEVTGVPARAAKQTSGKT